MAGDALGAPAEFLDRSEILEYYPRGLRRMVSGFGIMIDRPVGEVTDDTQMAACLQCSLERANGYDPAVAREEYLKWLATDPPDVGETVKCALEGHPNPESQGNGALMRVFPIALWALSHPDFDWQRAAMDDAAVTHPNFTCQLANLVFVSALLYALTTKRQSSTQKGAEILAREVLEHAIMTCDSYRSHPEARKITRILRASRHHAPEYDGEFIGWVLVTLQGAFYQLLHAPSLRAVITRSASAGGDTDTNAAVAAVLYAATFRETYLPQSWLTTLHSANPEYRTHLSREN